MTTQESKFFLYKQQHTDLQTIFKFTDEDLKLEKEVTVNGWVNSVREHGSTVFIVLSDLLTTETLQVVCARTLSEDMKKLANGVAVEVKGKIVKSRGKGQRLEMQALTLKVHSEHVGLYPVAKMELSKEYLRTIPHLRLRTPTMVAVMNIRSSLHQAVHKYYGEHYGFTFADLPFLTSSECEGGAFPFRATTLLADVKPFCHPFSQPYKQLLPSVTVERQAKSADEGMVYVTSPDDHKDFFHKPVYLTVSAQLHLECFLKKSYTMTRAFRAEPSHTQKHAAEITMLEHEFPFSTLEENIQLSEGFIRFAIDYVLSHNKSDVAYLDDSKGTLAAQLRKYADEPFIQTTHKEMMERMQQDEKEGKVKFDNPPKLDVDLSSEHEKYIVDVVYGGRPVVVKFYPKKIKSFYMPVVDDKEEVEHVDGFDILLPKIGELVGGSMREFDFAKMDARLTELGLDKSVLDFYLDLRRFGSVKHGGMGLGLDRFVMLCTSRDNIRDVIAFPRTYEQCQF